MSRRRIYVNGKPTWAPNEPGYAATVKGHGGISSGFWSGTQLTARQRRDNEPRVKLPRQTVAERRAQS